MSRRALACVIITLAASAAFAAPQQLSIAFTANIISVTGVTPAASVYIYGVSREASNGFVSVVPRTITLRD
ncbi:MAG TPA: hypothetical protein VF911_11900, partial [Thermoanaerobaculia bacterium]